MCIPPASHLWISAINRLLISCQTSQEKVTKFGERQSLECEAGRKRNEVKERDVHSFYLTLSKDPHVH